MVEFQLPGKMAASSLKKLPFLLFLVCLLFYSVLVSLLNKFNS